MTNEAQPPTTRTGKPDGHDEAAATGRESRGRRPWVSGRYYRRAPDACYGEAP